jgi:hypothetical protein
MVKFGDFSFCRETIKDWSFSIAITLPAFFTKREVRAPRPAPISIIKSPFPGLMQRPIFSIMR